jgi:hypothetical protein
MNDAPAGKTITRICPVISNAGTFEIAGKDGKKERRYVLAEWPCLNGRCQLWDVAKQRCGLIA